MFGTIKSLATTMRIAFRSKVTVEYPTERPVLAPRFMAHPVLTWDEEVHEPYCTGCLICMLICPTDVITVSMKDNPRFAAEESTRRKIVDDFELNIADCIMCGLCVDYCNFDAIVMSDNFELSKQSRTQLVQGLDQLLDGGRDQVARGRWSAPETKKSQRRAAAQGRAGDATAPAASDAPSSDDRVAASRAKAAAMRAQRALEAGGTVEDTAAPSVASTRPEGEVDPRVAAGRAKAAELRAQKAREREAAGAETGASAIPQLATTETTETDQPAVDPRVAEGRRKASELRAQKAAEREAASAEAGTPATKQPTAETTGAEQPAVDPRVVEGRRKAAELRAQKAREREEQQASDTDEADQR